MLAVVLTLGAMPVYGTFASAGTDEPTVETTDETPAPQGEPEMTPTPSGEPEASPTPGETPTESPEPGNTTYANSVSGTLWLDMFDDIDNGIYAGDGTRQAAEQLLEGYTVYLYAENDLGTAVQTTVTDTQGKYTFRNIEPGKYIAGVKATTMDGVEYLLPFWYLNGTEGDNRFVASYDEDEDAYIYAYTAPITVGADSTITGMDAGMRTVPGVQPMVYVDLAVGAATQTDSTNNPCRVWITAITATTSGLQINYSWSTYGVNVISYEMQYAKTKSYIPSTYLRLFYKDGGGTASASGTGSITIPAETGTVWYIRSYSYLTNDGGVSPRYNTNEICFTTRSITEYFHNIDASDTTYGVANNIQAAATLYYYNGTYTKSPASITTGSGTSATTYTYVGYNTTNNRATIGTSVSQSITANTSLYYYYQRNVAINFNANGGTGAPAAVTRASNATLGTVTSPTRAGYTFAGWNTATGGTGTTVSSGTYARAIPTTTNRNTTTLYAQWTVNNNTVAFNANGGTSTPANISRTAVTALGTLPTVARPGYTFAGWWTATSGGTQASATSTPIGLNSSLANNATLTLYARWTAHTITVQYDPNGGTGSMADSILTYGVDTTTTPNAFTRTGYEFTGWHAQRQDNCWYYVDPADTSQQGWYLAGSEPSGWIIFNYPSGADLAGMDAADGDVITLYAQWAPIVTVEYYTDSGTQLQADDEYTVTLGDNFIVTVPSFVGYVLMDWELDGVLQGDTNPTLIGVTAPHTVTLKYRSYYTITEKYVDQPGNAIVDSSSVPIPDTSQSITPGAAYNGSAASIPGYVCVGYKIGNSTDTFATATAGASGDTTPTISSVAAEHTVWFIYAQEIGSIKIEKYAHDGTTLLPGAEFQLEKLTGPGGTIDTTFTAQTLTTGAGGSVTFANLSAGSYRITETKAPAGHELLTAAFEVDIPKDITYAVGTPPADSSYLYSTTSGGNVTYHYYDVTYKVSDQASIAMPAAGAAGTFPSYALWGGGIILLAALGGGILWLKRRRAYSPRHG